MSQIQPTKVTLEKGKNYYYCTCGKSTNLPFCSNAHVDTNKVPKVFTATKDGDAYLCACRKSGNLPFCDNTHAK